MKKDIGKNYINRDRMPQNEHKEAGKYRMY